MCPQVRLRLITSGRISPVKKIEVLIDAFVLLKARGVDATFKSFGAAATPGDDAYEQMLRARLTAAGEEPSSVLVGKVPHDELPAYRAEADYFLHASETGSLDKTVLDAILSGVIPLSSSEAYTELFGEYAPELLYPAGSSTALAERIQALRQSSEEHREAIRKALRTRVVERHSLERLIPRIIKFFCNYAYFISGEYPLFLQTKRTASNVREMCNALALHTKVTLVDTHAQDLRRAARVWAQPRCACRAYPRYQCHPLGQGRLFTYVRTFCHRLGGICALSQRNAAVLTREYSCALIPALCGVPTAWESHRGEYNFLVRLTVAAGARIVAISQGLNNFYTAKGVAPKKNSSGARRCRPCALPTFARQRRGAPHSRAPARQNYRHI